MTPRTLLTLAARLTLSLACALALSYPTRLCAQSGQDLESLRTQIDELTRKTKYTEALPLLEKFIAAKPDDAEMQFAYGFALIAQANNTKEAAERAALRVRARNAFIKARDLKIDEPVVIALIDSLPPDGADGGSSFSHNDAANALMKEAEGFFAQGKLDQALQGYQRALALDSKIYEAALFSGDVFMDRQDFEQAEVWYQKAIAIDPTRETAYRYSATPLMKQKRFSEARDRYIEAFITEPYNRFSQAGLTLWANATNTSLGHPEIEIPSKVRYDESGKVNIDLDASILLGAKDDGSFAWIAYGTTRSQWHTERFARTFPKETKYRHSLAEETDALKSVIALATSDQRTKHLSPTLAALKKLSDDGLLESYILLAKADQGIAQDYPAYLKENRAKLRRYVVTYLLNGGKF